MLTSTDTTTPRRPGAQAGPGRDAVNRERFALRRLIRESRSDERRLERAMVAFAADQDDAKRAIERAWQAEHWGRDLERPAAWRAGEPSLPSSLHETASGRRVSWQALGGRAVVISADGARVGRVEHVLADAELDIFDGVVIDTRKRPGGHRFVDATAIAQIFRDRVLLTLRADQVHDLPRPSRNPAALRHRAHDPMPSALRLGARRVRGRIAHRGHPGLWRCRSWRSRPWDA